MRRSPSGSSLPFSLLGLWALGTLALTAVSWAAPADPAPPPPVGDEAARDEAAGDRTVADEAARDEAAVLAAVQAFLDALNTKDGPRLAATLMPRAVFHSAAENPRTGPIVERTAEEFVALVAQSPNELHERMWDAEVRVRGRIATVWTPYDFWIDGAFSHCGIDAFNLVETAEGWRISSAVYTTEQEDCEPSPLGPLDGR